MIRKSSFFQFQKKSDNKFLRNYLFIKRRFDRQSDHPQVSKSKKQTNNQANYLFKTYLFKTFIK